jgi:hypothetical protein
MIYYIWRHFVEVVFQHIKLLECVHKGFLIELEVEPKKGNGKKGKK